MRELVLRVTSPARASTKEMKWITQFSNREEPYSALPASFVIEEEVDRRRVLHLKTLVTDYTSEPLIGSSPSLKTHQGTLALDLPECMRIMSISLSLGERTSDSQDIQQRWRRYRGRPCFDSPSYSWLRSRYRPLGD